MDYPMYYQRNLFKARASHFREEMSMSQGKIATGLPVTAMILAAWLIAAAAPSMAYTIATFDDPTIGGSTQVVPFFEVDLQNNMISGGYDDSRSGLDLEVCNFAGGSTFYYDAFFTIDDLPLGAPDSFGTREITPPDADPYVLKFFRNNDPITASPILEITFTGGRLTVDDKLMASGMIFKDSIVITGDAIQVPLDEEIFSFGLSYYEPIDGDWDKGFTATAAFTSSGVPEPATFALLALGVLALLRCKRR